MNLYIKGGKLIKLENQGNQGMDKNLNVNIKGGKFNLNLKL